MCSDSVLKNLSANEVEKSGTINENLSPDDNNFFQKSNISFYQRPDPYEGLIDKIRQSMIEQEKEILQAKKIFYELKKKVEHLLPNGFELSVLPINSSNLSTPIKEPSTSHELSLSPVESSNIQLPKKSYKSTNCEICGLGFASVQTKVRHIKRIHPDDVDKIKNTYSQSLLPYVCSDCNKGFATRSNLTNHQRRHDTTRPRFNCEVCNKEYILPSELRKHMKRSHKVENMSSTTTSSVSSYSTVTNGFEDMPEI